MTNDDIKASVKLGMRPIVDKKIRYYSANKDFGK